MLYDRRHVLTGMALAGAVPFLPTAAAFAAEDRLETTSIRLFKHPSACLAPQYVVEELLRAEGFADINYVELTADADMARAIGDGKADFTQDFAARIVHAIDRGAPITVLSGIHIGCYELFANDRIRTLADLKGKRVGASFGAAEPHAFLAAIAAGIGLDPARDIEWVLGPSPSAAELFIAGKIDALLTFPPEAQALQARGIGHVLLNGSIDRPWSQYFCCMLAARGEYVRRYPVATKRVLRAFLKATDLCAAEPARAARTVVEKGITDRYDYALQAMREIPYDKWREYEPEDTLRFVSLRLREAGMIKSSPDKIIAKATDWRFLNELKRELKV